MCRSRPSAEHPVPPGTRDADLAQTSDDFFAEHDLNDVLKGVPLDLAFIDGMHQFEFALRDFINLERASNPTTTILIHDTLPVDELTAERDRQSACWSGDIWRLILLLKDWRPDLQVAVVNSAPTGVGVVRGLDPSSTTLTDHYDEIVAHYLSVPYSDLEQGSKAEMLNQIPGTWDTVQPILPDRPFRHSNVQLLKARKLFRNKMLEFRNGPKAVNS